MTGVDQDIRITKTQKALAETMMALVEKKSFQKITVNDICRSAMVSRSTFYLHFQDKYQLMLFCLQVERDELAKAIPQKSTREFLLSILTTVKAREKGYHNLFFAEVNLELLQMFRDFFLDFYSTLLTECKEQGVELAGPIPLLAVYYSNGLAGMIMWWIEKNFPVSVEEMALCQYNLLSDILPA